ncbi:hypothetical protein BX661DRAFT_178728 [Kickxella alabastrina]|uniref:uncharacterized protein n=1 Tax=Kickxella alabastrina TaxID=61397 RepID=UPI00221F74D7|nr:uncharacterized protein BX661DRAFT_178728 [Kickxella alabastrina]KAI7832887.1 hypothetical protein BX661DRAFT_178728 [Kickxella alabastrina]
MSYNHTDSYYDDPTSTAFDFPLSNTQLQPYQPAKKLQRQTHTDSNLNIQAARGRSESDGYRTMSTRSSDDRAPLTTFFGSQAWQRMSTALPQGVRDPLNIHELEREERLMPFTEVGISAMGDQAQAGAPSHYGTAQQGIAGEKHSAKHTSHFTANFVASSGGGAETAPSAIDWEYMQDHNLRTGGLPSLDQVLTRRTRAPLALRDFAVHCSVRQPQARRWLEFYMAARTHEKMCLAYDSDLRHAKARSHYASADSRILPSSNTGSASASAEAAAAAVAAESLDPSRRAAAHTAAMESLSRGRGDDQVLYPDDGANEAMPADARNTSRRSRRQSSRMAMQIQSSAETIFLRYFRAALDPSLMQGAGTFWQTNSTTSSAAAAARARETAGRSGKIGSLKRMLTQKTNTRVINGLRPTLDDPYHQGYGVAATDSVYGSAGGNSASGGRVPGGSGAASMYDNNFGRLGSTPSLVMSRDHLNTPITGDSDAPAMLPQYMPMHRPGGGGAFGSGSRQQHLYYHMPWPPEILTDIEQRLLHDGAALDAALFSEALLYAYDVLDTYYFPIFIADAVSRNVTRDHCVLRVLFAFVFLWFGFALPLALILLDHVPKAQRAWSVLPLFIGWWNMAVGFGGCDLLLAAMRKYQSPTMRDTNTAASRKDADFGLSKSPQQQPFGSLSSQVGGWRRAWFSTRMSVDMTATRMVRARSIRWFIGALAMTAITAAILCAVPGTRIYRN